MTVSSFGLFDIGLKQIIVSAHVLISLLQAFTYFNEVLVLCPQDQGREDVLLPMFYENAVLSAYLLYGLTCYCEARVELVDYNLPSDYEARRKTAIGIIEFGTCELVR